MEITRTLLSRLDNMVKQVNNTNASSEKIAILKTYSDLKPFLKLLMDPLQTTGVTRKTVENYENKKCNGERSKKAKLSGELRSTARSTESKTFTHDVVELVQKLYSREYSGHDALEAVISLKNQYPEFEEVILRIADKNLQTRMGVKQINAAFPGLIKEFSVALAEDFGKKKSYFESNQKDRWLISRKFDGVRVITLDSGNGFQCYSRTGNPFESLNLMKKLLKSISPDWVFDGEICSIDSTGNENFADAVSQIRRKSVQMVRFRYYIFDILTRDEFFSGKSKETLGKRLERWDEISRYIPLNEMICLVNQTPYSPESLQTLLKKSSESKWEGLMLRRDAPYKGKRSNDILKYKHFETGEYKVLSIETGPMRVIDEKSGLEVTIETLKSVIINHKGYHVNVGSGFSLDERKTFYADPKKIVGKTISIRYFEESRDREGNISLRFPTFKYLYGQDRDC